jgi:hypothetical protein
MAVSLLHLISHVIELFCGFLLLFLHLFAIVFIDGLSHFGEHFGLEPTQTSNEEIQEGNRAFLEQERIAPTDTEFEAVLDV